jgi:hypothetical protein
MIKNITPFFLDGGVQEVATGNSEVTWNGTSSFVTIEASGARNFILPDNVNGKKIPFGTMVVIVKSDDNTNVITVNPTSDVSDTVASVALSAQYQTCMFMFKGPRGSNVIGEWALLSFGVSGSFTGGTVAGATTFTGGATFSGTTPATFSSQATFSSVATFNSIPLFQGGIHMSSVAITAAGTSQTDATQLTTAQRNSTVVYSNPSANNQGIRLADNLTSNKVVYVFNTSTANNLKVYPIVGGSMNGTSNGSVTIAPSSGKMLFCLDTADNWIAS